MTNECTHTHDAVFGLNPGHGKGAKIYAGALQIDDTEYVTTGFDFVYALVTTPIANLGTATDVAGVDTLGTTGQLTMSVVNQDGSAATNSQSFYVIAVGIVR